jgi:hypothetical protein
MLLLVADCETENPFPAPRADRVAVTNNPPVDYSLDADDGNTWDNDFLTVNVPAGAPSTTTQLISQRLFPGEVPSPDSLSWILLGFRIKTADAPLPASIGDFVWKDLNGNGIQDAGEPGVSGVKVDLLDSGGTVVGTTTTNGNGLYLFSGLTPGQYCVRFTAPVGCAFTTKDVGANDAVDSDADPATGKTALTTLSPGENDLSWDAGLVQTERLGAQGCTPGYWKNDADKKGAVSWPPTGYSPNQTLESVFDVPDALGKDNVTLLEALSTGGGGVDALLRHAVAALLNAAHPNVDYAKTSADVISAVNAALASGNATTIENLKNDLDKFNNGGCPLNHK